MPAPQNLHAALTDRLLSGDKGALARLITWAENGDARFADVMRALHPRVGRAWRVGVTGPPGAGKSTLVNELARCERATGRTVGILAVEPSSPFTGGALLGDRIRMEERTNDSGVYIRSMASRGSHGGLARAAVDACDAMDVFGIDTVLLETVGVGQAEYDIVAATDTVLVVLCPGAGDGIQAMKAGILEVADVLVVNKADLAGADRVVLDLEEAVHIREHTHQRPDGAWHVPVVSVSAGKGEGLDLLAARLAEHRLWLATGAAPVEVCTRESRPALPAAPAPASRGRLAAVRREKRLAHVRRVVDERLDEALWLRGGLSDRAGALLDAGRAPYDVVEALVAAIVAGEVFPRGPKHP
ncbi:MAG: methylmalonyl Co-A mutase-associated GTPase MeaB [Chloroflexi bacterium]|nr:methylmalonyl Co-A mutase-associated GTPase MeaB [Chloroflexota bacterium]